MALKITPEDLAKLKAKVQPLDTAERRAQYKAGNFAGADRVKDLDKRYRWDLVWASRVKIGDGAGVKGDIDLYAYMDDGHIDSALRSFIQPL